ncbi:AraC family transcriptional regulator [Bacillaceae bacterium SIJ1]|uniref:helix-turn-helix domain-containing protein n=1 Tax=Litoribacterium kuwaitense TaxID=1398745 RepID=UPI0013E9FEDE|nr:helix-turn-helix domain-containing protein [Litoribacterium kuwaitense]NGP45293.1 AraC family transcriptional regulator [Litoribacterium kuwaitense]
MPVWNGIKSKLVYKYIVSYLFVFMIPFVFMSIFIYTNSVSGLRKEIEQSNLNKLEQVENLTNERIQELEKLASRIAYDPRLTPYMMTHGYYGGEALDELKKYKANSSMIDELFVYFYKDQQTIYSSSSYYTFKTLTQNVYQFKSWEAENIVQHLHTSTPLILPIEEIRTDGIEQKILAYIVPIAPNNPNPYGAVMYFIKEKSLTHLMENLLGDFNGNTYILDEQWQPIVSIAKDRNIDLNEIDIRLLENNGVDTIQIDGKEYSLTTVSSDVSGWTFLTVMDGEQFFARVVHQETFILTLLMTVLVVGAAAAILFGRIQYRPIRRLLEFAAMKSTKTSSWNDGKNELETIRLIMTNLMTDHKNLVETVDLQKPYAKEQFLAKMLKEHFATDDQIDDVLGALNVDMSDGPHFVVVVELIKKSLDDIAMDDREQALEALSNLSLPQAAVHGVNLLYQDAMAFIISCKQAEDVKAWRHKSAEDIQKYVRNQLTFNEMVIAVGTSYEQKKQINRSFIEALAALDYRFAVSQGSIIYFEEIGYSSENAGYPKEDQLKLVQSLKQGDSVVALETFHTMLENVVQTDISIQSLKYIFYDIINTVIKTAMELRVTENMDEFNEIGDFNSVEQLGKRLGAVIINVCESVEQQKENRSQQLKKELLQYIQDHYKDNDLSLEAVARHFQLSVPYLSKFFKEQTGETFTQYVVSLRIAQVKKLLSETNQPIKEIVTAIGYRDVANFTRRFKQIEGVTPGQFRKLNR